MKKQLYTAVMAASMLFTAVPVSLYNNSIIVCSAEEKNFKIGDIITDNGLSFEVKGEQYFSDKTDADGNFIEEMTDSGYYWLSVAGYSGNEQEITIPKTLSGLDITSINVDAFRDNKIIRKVYSRNYQGHRCRCISRLVTDPCEYTCCCEGASKLSVLRL
jgi:hypothetical protein